MLNYYLMHKGKMKWCVADCNFQFLSLSDLFLEHKTYPRILFWIHQMHHCSSSIVKLKVYKTIYNLKLSKHKYIHEIRKFTKIILLCNTFFILIDLRQLSFDDLIFWQNITLSCVNMFSNRMLLVQWCKIY